ACVTSIVRTYYTSTLDDRNVSYVLIIMGQWIWGEMAAGILIGCLPVMPRFFQHIGPKVYTSLKSNIITGSIFAGRSRSTGIVSEYEFNEPSTRPLKKHSSESNFFDKLDESVMHTSVRKGSNSNIHGLGAAQQDIRVERSITISESPVTRQGDVETGRYTF
ncbi:MAG: hypothetical protein Q9188_003166, partial [Gyalolechia gomerana]